MTYGKYGQQCETQIVCCALFPRECCAELLFELCLTCTLMHITYKHS